MDKIICLKCSHNIYEKTIIENKKYAVCVKCKSIIKEIYPKFYSYPYINTYIKDCNDFDFIVKIIQRNDTSNWYKSAMFQRLKELSNE